MAKAVKKKTPVKASNTFHNIMAASVKGNPKSQNKMHYADVLMQQGKSAPNKPKGKSAKKNATK